MVGASGGIGRVLAQRLASEGYALALVDRNGKVLKDLCGELNQVYEEMRAISYEHDVTAFEKVPDLLRRVVAELVESATSSISRCCDGPIFRCRTSRHT